MSSRPYEWLTTKLLILSDQKKSIELIPREINQINEELSIKAADPDKVVVSGGTNHSEDVMLENICRRDELEKKLKFVKESVDIMESALSVLNEEERTVIERMYINRIPNSADSLAFEFNCEIANVYKIKNKALKRLARCLAGIAEL